MKLRTCFITTKYLLFQTGILKLAIHVFSTIIYSQCTTQNRMSHMERMAVTHKHKVHNRSNYQINLQNSQPAKEATWLLLVRGKRQW